MYFINLLSYIIFKQTLPSAGANLTVEHIREVALFLIEAAANADKTFSVPPRSLAHTTSDVADDVKTLLRVEI